MPAALAIVCGGGAFPLAVADAASATRRVFLIGVTGISDPAIARHPHGWIRMGQFGRLLDLVREAGCNEILFVGAVARPATWYDIRPDFTALRQLPRILRSLMGGDDRLLKGLAAVITDAGLTIRGVAEVAPDLMLPPGPLGRVRASKSALADAAYGFEVLDALSPFDVGQGVVIAGRRVIAIEAAEGTDLMLDRIARLREANRLRLRKGQGVFVKAAKRGQDIRLDTPAIGPETLEHARAAGLAGIAVAAGQVMAIDTEKMIAAADEAGLFLLGMDRGAP